MWGVFVCRADKTCVVGVRVLGMGMVPHYGIGLLAEDRVFLTDAETWRGFVSGGRISWDTDDEGQVSLFAPRLRLAAVASLGLSPY